MDELMTLLEEMALRIPSRVVLGHIFCWLVEITEITTNRNNGVRYTLAISDKTRSYNLSNSCINSECR